MQLYRFQVSTSDGECFVVVAAANEETAFQLADDELQKHFIKMPKIEDVTLFEKKKIRDGAGFVITSENI